MDTPLPPNNTPAVVKRVSLIPDDQNAVAELLLRVATNWGTRPQFVLLWTNQPAITQLALDLAALVKTRQDLTADRSPVAQKIETLDRKINMALTSVKGYINDKWEDDDEAESYYPVFGMVVTSAGDMLAAGQRERIAGIEKLMQALTDHGLGGSIKGTAFWQGILDAYTPLVDESEKAAEGISGAAGAKNPKLERARLFLSRFNLLLEAQTETEAEYLALRREMGYLKEYN